MTRFIAVWTIVASVGSAAAADAATSVRLGDRLASHLGAKTIYDGISGAENNSYWQIGESFGVLFSPTDELGKLAQVDGRVSVGLGLGKQPKLRDLKRLAYTTRTGDTPANVEVTLRAYTALNADAKLGANDGDWYQRALCCEPLYFKIANGTYDEVFRDGRWCTFATDHAEAPMTFYDSDHGPRGYTGPNLEQIKEAGKDNLWTEFGQTAEWKETSYAYGDSPICMFAISTSTDEQNWKDFSADIDTLTIELTSGESVTVHFDRGEGDTFGTLTGGGGGGATTWIVIGVVGIAVIILVVAALALGKRKKPVADPGA